MSTPIHKILFFTLVIILMPMFLFEASAQSNHVSIYQEGKYRLIESNGIPDHAPGQFPNRGNPNRLSEQAHHYRVPLHPQFAGETTWYDHDLFGVALNGIPFDPATAEYWQGDRSSGWNYDALSGKINLGIDQNNAHVQPDGTYHYHGVPKSLVSGQPLTLIGYAADGFPIYFSENVRVSYRLKPGTRPSGPGGNYDGTYSQDYEYIAGLGDLDECNGRTAPTKEYPNGIYQYYLTRTFPFVPRCLKGTPDNSFKKQRPQGTGPRQRPSGPGGSGGLPRPPQEAIFACSGMSDGGRCQFQAPHGSISGICRHLDRDLACVPN